MDVPTSDVYACGQLHETFATLLKIIDNFATTPEKAFSVSKEYYRMLFHLVDVDRHFTYPFQNLEERQGICEYTWNQLRSSLLEANPESDASIYPTFDATMRIATTEYIGSEDTVSCIMFLQQHYYDALEYLNVMPLRSAEIPQRYYFLLGEHEVEHIEADPVGYTIACLEESFHPLNLTEDLEALTQVMTFFMELIYDACYCVEQLGFVYNEAKANEFLIRSVNIRASFWLCSPFCELSRAARRTLSKVDIEGAFRALMTYAYALVEMHPPTEINYRLYQFFVLSAVKAWSEDNGTMMEYLRASKERDGVDLYDMINREPVQTDLIEDFFPERHCRVFPAGGFTWDEYDEDVEYEPEKPRRS